MTKEKKTKKKKRKNYFTLDTQNKIIEYQNTTDLKLRSIIYEHHVYPAFTELVHNLVSVYKFKSLNEDMSHLKHDCVSFLFEQIHKWNPEKGTKAFSYFNVVAKNWLTIQSRKLLKMSKKNVHFEDPELFTSQEKKYLREIEPDNEQETLNKKNKLAYMIIDIIDHIECHLKEGNDTKCAHAVRTVFENIDNLDYLNKRAVFVYLREISGLNSSELSSSLSSIRKIYRKVVGHDKKFDIFNIE
jgi:hypothetical protein